MVQLFGEEKSKYYYTLPNNLSPKFNTTDKTERGVLTRRAAMNSLNTVSWGVVCLTFKCQTELVWASLSKNQSLGTI